MEPSKLSKFPLLALRIFWGLGSPRCFLSSPELVVEIEVQKPNKDSELVAWHSILVVQGRSDRAHHDLEIHIHTVQANTGVQT